MALEINWTDNFLFITNRDEWVNITLQTLLLLSKHFNTFPANAPILYPQKTSENFWLCNVFRGYKMRTLVRNGLICVTLFFIPVDTYIFWKIESLKEIRERLKVWVIFAFIFVNI